MICQVWLYRQQRLKFHKTTPRKVDLLFVEGGATCVLAAERGAINVSSDLATLATSKTLMSTVVVTYVLSVESRRILLPPVGH
jgi:hypothetical protein